MCCCTCSGMSASCGGTCGMITPAAENSAATRISAAAQRTEVSRRQIQYAGWGRLIRPAGRRGLELTAAINASNPPQGSLLGRAHTPAIPPPPTAHSPYIPALPLRHSRAPLRHSCAGRNPPRLPPHCPTSPFPNSSLPPSRGEVRWGVEAPSHPQPPSTPRSPPPSFPRPSPSFLRRQEPTAPPTPLPHLPLPQFIPPPFQGEVRWGVECHEPPPTDFQHPDRLPHHSRTPPLSFLRASLRHSCAGRNLGGPPRLLRRRSYGGGVKVSRRADSCLRRNDGCEVRGVVGGGRVVASAPARCAAPPT